MATKDILMIIDCISDLHGHYPKLEGGDLLIVAGDLTARHTPEEHGNYIKWQYVQNYRKIIFIAGNHDDYIAKRQDLYLDGCCPDAKVVYLQDSGIEFEGLNIWGSPWSLCFPGINPKCKAFTGSENDLANKWNLIPEYTNILITHSPPYLLFDDVNGESVGSKTLDETVFYLLKLELHVFGHIHEEGGKVNYRTKGASDRYISVNCSYVNEHYKPVHKPVRIIL